ncbi:PLP-dependent aminotransferase family protein [Deferribacteres bacterium DY0037]|nr:PLP-dependent aminotransferase family protein [Denitrovibrio acetiphilus]
MSGKSLYIQIADCLRRSIVSGELKPCTKLSQRIIAKQFDVSKKTAYDALMLLEAEGLVSSKPRSGTVVSNNAWLLLAAGCSPDWKNYIERGRQIPSKERIFHMINDLSSGRKIHVSGPRIGQDLGYALTLSKVMPRVMKRLETTNDLNEINIKGIYSLRVTLCERLKKYGIEATPDEVMITTGVAESLAIISWSFLCSSMTFIHDTPSVLNSMQLIRSSGANIVRIPLDNYGMKTEPLSKVFKNTSRCILYINPTNQYPSGVSLSKTRRDKILSMCTYSRVPVLENDMLREFWLDKPNPLPMKAFDKGGLVIYIGCTIGVNIGFKLSWIVAPGNIISRLSDVKTQYDINTNTLLQITADELFKSGHYDEFIEESRPLFLKILESAYEIIERYLKDLIKPLNKVYGYYIWVVFSEQIDVVKIYDDCKEIMFLPGYFFDNTDSHSLHLAPFADSIENFEEAVRIIAREARKQLKTIV